jgi:ferredoxin-type protein NapH
VYQLVRRIVQAAFLLASNSYFAAIPAASFYQGAGKGVCVPALNCYACPLAWGSCPIGALQHFVIVRQFPFYVLGIVGVIGVFAGRFPCGWFCPFGWFQEVIYKLRLPKFSAPNWLRHAKFAVLGLVAVVVVWWTFEPWFCKVCPAGTLEAGLPWLAWSARGSPYAEGMRFTTWIFSAKIAILAVVVLLAGMMRRPFCRFVCPLGALFGLTNRVSMVRIDVDAETCTECGACARDCPMDLTPHKEIDSIDCIRCLACTWCDSLKVTTIFGSRVRVPTVGAAAPGDEATRTANGP